MFFIVIKIISRIKNIKSSITKEPLLHCLYRMIPYFFFHDYFWLTSSTRKQILATDKCGLLMFSRFCFGPFLLLIATISPIVILLFYFRDISKLSKNQVMKLSGLLHRNQRNIYDIMLH